MNTMEAPRAEKVETLKDLIENISAVNNEIRLQLAMVANALVDYKHPSNDSNNPEDTLSIMDSMRRERDKAEENLRLLVSIREHLW